MANEKKISILGCGWLGLPVAAYLVQSGYLVKGSTTTPAKLNTLAGNKIQPYLINLNQEFGTEELTDLLEANYLIISFPPGLRAGNGENYRQQILKLSQALEAAPIQNILFISSTSVYPESNKLVTEAEDLQPFLAQNPLLQAETIICNLPGKKTTVLRMGGLVGGERHPGRFLAGKQNLPNPEGPVNLIHLDDCIGIIAAIFQRNKWGEIYNACADEHPSRQVFYTAAAQKLNLPEPQFSPPSSADTYKIISNQKVKKNLSYRFIHPEPMLFF